MLPNERDWQTFYDHIRKATRLDLNLYKANQLQRRIVGMIETRKCKDLTEFWKSLSTDPKGMEWFLDKLAINVSELFRNPEKWTELERDILPDLLKRSAKLKVWSAGCSIGAEAYSLAAILAVRFPGAHQVIGTDIDQAALRQAQQGKYAGLEARTVPEPYRSKAFTLLDGAMCANPELKKLCAFKTGNLLEGPVESGCDLIMCRNVVIYFTEEAKDGLYRRFFDALKPGGVLFVGSTERIFNARDMGYESKLPFFYQKPTTGERTWRNAS